MAVATMPRLRKLMLSLSDFIEPLFSNSLSDERSVQVSLLPTSKIIVSLLSNLIVISPDFRLVISSLEREKRVEDCSENALTAISEISLSINETWVSAINDFAFDGLLLVLKSSPTLSLDVCGTEIFRETPTTADPLLSVSDLIDKDLDAASPEGSVIETTILPVKLSIGFKLIVSPSENSVPINKLLFSSVRKPPFNCSSFSFLVSKKELLFASYLSEYSPCKAVSFSNEILLIEPSALRISTVGIENKLVPFAPFKSIPVF